MNEGLHDIIRHNAWATGQVVAFCQGIDAADLDKTVPGTYGTIIATLRHMLDAESRYLLSISNVWETDPWERGVDVSLEVLAERAALLVTSWEQFLASSVDLEQRLELHGDDPKQYTTPFGVILTQAIHHGNEHRAHICTTLGALGYEGPDVSAWGYGFASGRSIIG